MKRLIAMALCLVCLCACSAKTEEKTSQNTISTTAQTENLTSEKPTEAVTESPTQAETETSSAKIDEPETMKLKGYIPVYDGPSYDDVYKQTIGKDGIYTITEESIDGEGNKWGRLKSGIGWVDLSLQEEYSNSPIVISHIYEDIGEYEEYIADDSEFTEKIAFVANEKLTDVRFLSLTHDGINIVEDKVLYEINELTPDKPFILGIVFYGDMTTYGVSFKDENGVNLLYSIYTSGRNGSLVWEEVSMEK
ncbi:MAG: hypothetical protein E7432_08155 [Ruminococcaceae bacterium]|nr:hypothetical protein [Oscillospiraceae bacterium]